MQKKLIVLFAFAIFVLVLGWAITPVQAHIADPGGDCPHTTNPDHKHCAGGGGDSGGGSIRVMVTFRDEISPLDRLMSDCGIGDCPYIHKVEKVSANIGTTGNLAMKLTKGSQPPIRTLFYDFSDCASGDGTCLPPFLQGFSVGPANMFTRGVNLREMEVGEARGDLSLLVSLNLTSVEGGLWLLLFDPPNSFVNADCPGSSNIGVTRTGADTWEIEAGGDFGAVACLLEEISPSDLILSGRYFMPFKMTVQKK